MREKKFSLFAVASIIMASVFIFTGVAMSADQDTKNNKQEIGEKEEPVYQAFLRQTTVILNPWQHSVNLSLGYKRNKIDNLFASQITRELGATLSYHLGLPKNIEAYLSVPGIWKEQTNQDQFAQKETKDSKAGIGDLSLGAKFILFQEKGSVPDIIGSLEIGMPTGDDPYSEDSEDLGLGLGHWSGTAGLTLVKSCDPAVIYGGFSYTHIFEKTYNKKKIEPGAAIGYNLGVAFLINDKLTLSEQLIGSYLKLRFRKVFTFKL